MITKWSTFRRMQSQCLWMMMRFWSNCCGRHIHSVSVANCGKREKVEYMAKFLKDINIRLLRVASIKISECAMCVLRKANDDTDCYICSASLLEIIVEHKILIMTMTVGIIESEKPGDTTKQSGLKKTQFCRERSSQSFLNCEISLYCANNSSRNRPLICVLSWRWKR